jgi:hypothetical protein
VAVQSPQLRDQVVDVLDGETEVDAEPTVAPILDRGSHCRILAGGVKGQPGASLVEAYTGQR